MFGKRTLFLGSAVMAIAVAVFVVNFSYSRSSSATSEPDAAAASAQNVRAQPSKTVQFVADGGFWFASGQTSPGDYAQYEMHVGLSENGNPYFLRDDGTAIQLTEERWLQSNKGHFLIVEVTPDGPWREKVRSHPDDPAVRITTALCKAHIPVRTFAQWYNTDQGVDYSSACEPILGKKAAFYDLMDR